MDTRMRGQLPRIEETFDIRQSTGKLWPNQTNTSLCGRRPTGVVATVAQEYTVKRVDRPV